jgi:Histidine kinase
MPVETEAEVRRLRAVLRDLIALSNIPAAWIDREPPVVASGLADTLIEFLQLDFVFVRLRGPSGAGAVEVMRGTAWESFPHWLERRLGVDSTHKEVISDAGDGVEAFRAVVIPVGVDAEGGVVAAASDRADFPTEIDQLLLSLAANQAATAFESARIIHERKRAEGDLLEARNELEAKVTERTAELRRSEAHLAASRARIVTAADETRRQIERDLHDGVQQRLVSLAFELKTLEAALPDDELKAQLAHTATALTGALEDLVEISRGIHPAILAEGGLASALQTLAGDQPCPSSSRCIPRPGCLRPLRWLPTTSPRKRSRTPRSTPTHLRCTSPSRRVQASSSSPSRMTALAAPIRHAVPGSSASPTASTRWEERSTWPAPSARARCCA